MPATMQSINPTTEELMKEFKCLNNEKAFSEVKKSREAFKGWSKLDIKERCSYLKRLAAVLKKNSRKYGEIITKEMGKPIKQAVAEVEKCAWACEFYADNAERFLQDDMIKTDARKSYVMFQPLGVIMGIMPWNFPFWQVFRFAASTLAAGNCVVVKHASNVPQCAIAIEECFREAGFPEYVYRNLLITSKTVAAITDADLVDGLSLTGSTEAGRRVGELAGRNIKKVVLELGGSDPFILLDDADLKLACDNGITARFQNAGQSCIAAKRFAVHEEIADEFKEKFSGLTETLVVDNPMNEKTNIGPLARDDLRINLERQLKIAMQKGARIIVGGKRLTRKGYFFQPTVIEAKKDNPVVKSEETFGPVASVIIAKNDNELLEIANSSSYGLGASIWSSDLERAERFARKIEAGAVFVNGIVKSDPRLPFGGIKKSGIGRELSQYGIKEFVNIKTVVIS